MTITVTKTHSVGTKTTTTTASAEVPDYISPSIMDADEEERQTIIRITRALIVGMEPPMYISNEEGNIVGEVTSN